MLLTEVVNRPREEEEARLRRGKECPANCRPAYPGEDALVDMNFFVNLQNEGMLDGGSMG